MDASIIPTPTHHRCIKPMRWIHPSLPRSTTRVVSSFFNALTIMQKNSYTPLNHKECTRCFRMCVLLKDTTCPFYSVVLLCAQFVYFTFSRKRQEDATAPASVYYWSLKDATVPPPTPAPGTTLHIHLAYEYDLVLYTQNSWQSPRYLYFYLAK